MPGANCWSMIRKRHQAKETQTRGQEDIRADSRAAARTRYRLLGFCVLVALATTAGFGMILGLGYRSALEGAEASSAKLVSGFEHYARQSFEESASLLRDLGEDIGGIDLDAPDAEARITAALAPETRRLLYMHRFIVVVAGPAGNPRIIDGRAGGTPAALDVAAHVAAHRRVDGRGLYIGAPARLDQTGEWVIPVSRSLHAADGGLRAAVIGLVEPRQFSGIFKSFHVGAHGVVTLLRRDGTLLAREPEVPGFLGTSVAQGALFTNRLPQASRGTFRALALSTDGVERVVSYATVDPLPLVVVVGIAVADALAGWWVLALQYVVIYCGILALLAGFAWTIARQLHRRELAEAEARQATDRLADLIDSVPGVVYERHTTADGQVSFPFVSSKALDLGGLTGDALSSNPNAFWNLIHPDDRARMQQAARQGFTDGTAATFEYRIVRGDGATRWMLANATAHAEPDGGHLARGVVIDVTDRKQAEASARAATDRLRDLINSVPGVVYQRRFKDGRIDYTFASSKASDILGVTAEELVQDVTALLRRIHPSDVASFIEGTERSARSGTPLSLEFRLVDPSGEERWVQTMSTPHRGNDGEILWEGVGIDITAQKRAVAALAEREREQRLRLIANNLPVSITYFDNEGRYQFVNRTAEAWHGRSAADTMGRGVAEILPSGVLGGRPDAIDELLAGRAIHAERWQRFPDGRERLLEDMLVPDLTDEGVVRGIINLSIDITERRATEERLRQSQRMESLGQLAGGVAHDFNNILGVIVGSLDVLQFHLGDRPRERELVDRVLSAARRGASLTNRLLMVANRRALQPVSTDLNALVRDLASLLGATLGEGMSLGTVLADDLPPCLVDPGGLESAIVNLAINARDAMPDGGRLEIATRDLPARDAAAGGGFVSLTVSDTGTGMPPEVARRAFEPFFTTKEIGRGTGLGLSMVYGFVTQSGGRINLKSIPGQGTEIEILLPRAVPEPAPTVPAMRPMFRAGGQAVLVVEDDRDMRTFITEALTQAGFAVVAVADAESALALVAGRDDIELVVSDVMLAGAMNGLTLVRELRRSRPGIRAVVTSGYVHGDVDMRRAARDTDILHKPFRVDELIERVARQFDLAGAEVENQL